MKYSKILLATAALGVLSSAATQADAATKHAKKHTTKRASSTATSAQTQEIRDLRAQVQALTARLDAQETAQHQAQSDAAQAAASASEAKMAAAQAQTTAATAQQTADKTAKDTAPMFKAVEWAKDTKISGRVYFNTSYIDHKANGTKVGNTDNGVGFALKRFYLGVDHKFNDVFSANVTTDVSSVTSNGASSPTGLALYVKKAYLQAKIDPALIVRIGAADMPWIPYVEGIYGYRHIEQTLSDRTKFGTSTDWGVHVGGDLANGIVSYQLSAVSGAGYRNPTFSKSVDFEGRLSAKYHGFNAAIGGYSGKLGKDTESASAANVTPDLETYGRINALLAYQGKIKDIPFTIGGEYFYAENKVFNSTAPLVQGKDDHADGYSGFASVNFLPKWSAFGRVDIVKPAVVSAYGLKNDYYNLGVQWSPAKIVDLALVYKHEQAKDGAFATGSLQSGVIGCATSASQTCIGKGTYDEIGLYGQFRF
jgi:hypothetical protein